MVWAGAGGCGSGGGGEGEGAARSSLRTAARMMLWPMPGAARWCEGSPFAGKLSLAAPRGATCLVAPVTHARPRFINLHSAHAMISITKKPRYISSCDTDCRKVRCQKPRPPLLPALTTPPSDRQHPTHPTKRQTLSDSCPGTKACTRVVPALCTTGDDPSRQRYGSARNVIPVLALS